MRKRSSGFSLIEVLVAITVIAILTAMLAPALRTAKESGCSAKCLSNLRQVYLANCLYAENHGGFFVLASQDIWTTNLKRWHGERLTTVSPFDPSKSPLVSYLGKDGKVKVCPSLRDFLSTGPAAYEAGSGGYGYNDTYVGGRSDLYGVTPESFDHSLSVNDGKAWGMSKFVMFGDAGKATASGLIEESSIAPPFWQDNPDPNPVSAIASDPTLHFRHNGHANVIWCDGHATSEQMSFTTATSALGGDNYKHHLGWFGPGTSNRYWKPE